MYRFRDTLPINISEQTISGDLVTIENPEEMGVIDSLEVSLSPIQSLNGYDKPWSGGNGKNLFWVQEGSDWSGISCTLNSKGAYVLNGTTASGTPAFIRSTAVTLKAGTYRLWGKADNNPQNRLLVRIRNATTMALMTTVTPDNGTGANVSIAEDTSVLFEITVYDSSTLTNTVVYPQLEVGTTKTEWEPYENICPISGRTEVVTQRTGKNLFDVTSSNQTINGVTFTVAEDNSITVNGTATADTYYYVTSNVENYLIAGKQYIVNGCPSSGGSSRYGLEILYGRDPIVWARDIGSGYTFTATDSINLRAEIFVTNGTQVDNVVFKPMLRLASDPDATYEPYQGTTYTTALGRTVYGGTLDVVSGVLTVDRASITIDGDVFSLFYNGQYSTGNTEVRFTPTPTKANGATNLIADRFRTVNYTSAQAEVGMARGNPTRGFIYFCVPPTVTSKAEAIAYFQANPTQVCYPLATPQTYQLTPQQIDLLLGTNHLWSDGEISVVWHKDLTKGRALPTEAVSINGQYIENVLDGYRTLYTKGRESLGAELNTYSVGTADGEKFKNKRYPARELTIGFQLIADNAEDFREKFNNLNNLLSLDEADFIFHDEEDKFFSGYPIMDAEVEAGQDSVKGEWHIYCAYPFKRSVDPITLTMADATVTNTTATFTIDYKGARPARPVLRAKFAGALSGGSSSEDGDCGFVAFMDGEENIVQLGNPDVLDLDEYASAETLINKEFVNVSDWTRTGGHTYKGTVTGSVSTSDTVDAFWNGGVGQTQSYAKPSYGSGTGLHGSILWKNTAGAVNFTLNAVHRLCVNNSNETGVFEVGAYNHSTGKMVAGFVIDKSGNGTTGVVRYIVNSKQVGTDQIDLSYYNNHFGYCNRTPVYVQQTYYDPVQQTYKVQVKTKKKKKKKKYVTKSRTVWVARTRTVQNGWNYTQSNLNSSVQKDGSYVYIQVGNLPMRTFNVPDVEEMIAHDASVYMGTYGTAMNTNMIHSLLFRRETGAVFAEQPNVFTAGDIVEADCNEATVYIYRDGSIGGHLEPQYGALGNDWEDFLLTSGTNVIRATWSDWVNPTYKPQIEIEYNEVFI